MAGLAKLHLCIRLSVARGAAEPLGSDVLGFRGGWPSSRRHYQPPSRVPHACPALGPVVTRWAHPSPPKPRADAAMDAVHGHSLPSGPHCHFLPKTWGLCRLPAQPRLSLVPGDPELKQRKRQLPQWFGNFPECTVPATKIPQPRTTPTQRGRWRRNNGLCNGPGASRGDREGEGAWGASPHRQ